VNVALAISQDPDRRRALLAEDEEREERLRHQASDEQRLASLAGGCSSFGTAPAAPLLLISMSTDRHLC